MKEPTRLTSALLALACVMFVLCVICVVWMDSPFAAAAFAMFGVFLLPSNRRE